MRTINFILAFLFLSLGAYAQSDVRNTNALPDSDSRDLWAQATTPAARHNLQDSITAVCKLLDSGEWMVKATSVTISNHHYKSVDASRNFLKVSHHQVTFQYDVPSATASSKHISRKQVIQMTGTTGDQNISIINKKVSKKGRVVLRIQLSGKTDHYHVAINPLTHRVFITLRSEGFSMRGKLGREES